MIGAYLYTIIPDLQTINSPAGIDENLGDDFDSLDRGSLGEIPQTNNGEDSIDEEFGEDSKEDLDEDPFRNDF